MKTAVLILSLWIVDLKKVQSLNILSILPYPGKSHFFAFDRYLKELASRGHNVTVISYFPRKVPIQNYHDISLADKTNILQDIFSVYRSHWEVFKISFFLISTGIDNCKTLLDDENVQNLWKTNAKFDVIVTEQFNSDCSLGLAYKLGGPVVALNSHVLMPWQYSRYGIPYNPSYMPFQYLDGGTKPTFFQRVERTFYHAYFTMSFKFFCQRANQNTLAQYFDDVPPLDELGHNMKFLLTFNTFMLAGPTLLPSNVIEVGGYHVDKPKRLPDNILDHIEESKNGVIYISFGSMLKASSTPKDKLQIIVEVLSELPQRVLWKWEEPNLPGNPKNILLSPWLPQNDILAHPNVLAFYSHCGMLSTTEAHYHGVPMVGMPIFGDQPANAGFMEESGLGVQIQIGDLTKEKLLDHFNKVLDPTFRERVKLLSKAWHDRAVSAMDSAVHWTEFAARYPNLTFTSPAVRVPFYQYYALDVTLFYVACFAIYLLVMFKIFSCLYFNIKSNSKSKSKKYQ